MQPRSPGGSSERRILPADDYVATGCDRCARRIFQADDHRYLPGPSVPQLLTLTSRKRAAARRRNTLFGVLRAISRRLPRLVQHFELMDSSIQGVCVVPRMPRGGFAEHGPLAAFTAVKTVTLRGRFQLLEVALRSIPSFGLLPTRSPGRSTAMASCDTISDPP